MTTGATCILYLDGTRFADGSPGDDLASPVALSGLKVNWGRDSTMDQPGSSTCQFDVMDRAGGNSFTGLTVGERVDVTASTWTYPDPSVSTMTDPGLETATWTGQPYGCSAAVTSQRAASGSRSLVIRPGTGLSWRFWRPPMPFADPGAPGAWEAVPTTLPGQTWNVGAKVFVPVGCYVRVSPVVFTGPWAGSGAVDYENTVTIVGDGTWKTASAPYSPKVAGAWLGVEINAFSGVQGPAWKDEPAALTWAGATSLGAWRDVPAVYADDFAVLAPTGGTEHTVLVFSGRITDLDVQYDDAVGGARVAVTSADFTADLENVIVGDQPWNVEAMADRFNRILALSAPNIPATIPSRLGSIPVTYRDVDAQPAAGLLSDLAVTVDGVLWSAVHQVTGPYLYVEDPSARQTQYVLSQPGGAGTKVIIVLGPIVAPTLALDACDVLRDPVHWLQTSADVASRVSVTWRVQGIDQSTNLPTTSDSAVMVRDASVESIYGVRGVSVTTDLQAASDATGVAQQILERASSTAYRASGLTVDDSILTPTADLVNLVSTLLDGTARNGLPLRLTNLPWWSPPGANAAVFLEGGAYTFDHGMWDLDLTVSNATGVRNSIPWNRVPSGYRWVDMATSITWNSLRAVGP